MTSLKETASSIGLLNDLSVEEAKRLDRTVEDISASISTSASASASASAESTAGAAAEDAA